MTSDDTPTAPAAPPAPPAPPVPTTGPTRLETALLGLFPLAKLVVHLWTIPGYGIFRDELYYLASVDHLAWGFVDHPPLSIAILAVWTGIFGDSLFTVRLVPALAGAATVLLVGLTARALGGRAVALAVSMAAALAAPIYLALDHFYSMNALDLLIWAAAAYLLVLLFRPQPEASEDDDFTPYERAERERRLWIALGVVLGLGLLNKISVLWLGAGIGVGLLATPARRKLATQGPWTAGLVSLGLFAPHLVWQAVNGWPTLEFMANATSMKLAPTSPLELLGAQVLTTGPLAALLWIAGLAFFLFAQSARPWRLLGVAWLTVFAILALSGSSRANYPAPSYTWLFAGGAVALELGLARLSNPRLARALGIAAAGALVGSGALIAPLALPILEVDDFIAFRERVGIETPNDEGKQEAALPQFYADMHGWEEIVDDLEAAFRSLPPEDQARARIVADNYGVAGAVDVLGARRGLPPALSGHNSYWMWGAQEIARGLELDVLILHGAEREDLEGLFGQVELAGTVDCGLCMPYENGQEIWIVRDPVDGLTAEEVWLLTKKYV